jgi:hypothetical protein
MNPHDRDVFPDEECLPSYVTDRPAPLTNAAASNGKGMPLDDQYPESCPSSIVCLLKIGALNSSKIRTTAILTDTPGKRKYLAGNGE